MFPFRIDSGGIGMSGKVKVRKAERITKDKPRKVEADRKVKKRKQAV